MPQNGGTLISAVMTLMTLFSYFWITFMSYGSTNNLKAMKTPQNMRGGTVNVSVVLKHINKVFPRP